MNTALLIHFDEVAYKKRMAHLEFYIQFFTKAKEIFNSFGFAELENEDLGKLICNPESFVAEKMLQSKQAAVKTFAGIGFNSQKILDLMDKPARYPELLEVIGKISYFIDKEGWNGELNVANPKELLRCYTFNDQGEICVIQSYYDSCKRACETYISSERAKAHWAYANELIDLHKKYGILYPQPFSNAKFFEEIIKVNDSIPSPNFNFIEKVDRNARGQL